LDSGPTAIYLITGIVISYLLSSFFSCVKIVFLSMGNAGPSSDNDDQKLYSLEVESIFKNRSMLSCTVSIGKTIANSSFSVFVFLLTARYLDAQSITWKILSSVLISFFFISLIGHEIPRAIALKHYRFFFNPFLFYIKSFTFCCIHFHCFLHRFINRF
jgi:Mg2+/Co2+ transporter CorB